MTTAKQVVLKAVPDFIKRIVPMLEREKEMLSRYAPELMNDPDIFLRNFLTDDLEQYEVTMYVQNMMDNGVFQARALFTDLIQGGIDYDKPYT